MCHFYPLLGDGILLHHAGRLQRQKSISCCLEQLLAPFSVALCSTFFRDGISYSRVRCLYRRSTERFRCDLQLHSKESAVDEKQPALRHLPTAMDGNSQDSISPDRMDNILATPSGHFNPGVRQLTVIDSRATHLRSAHREHEGRPTSSLYFGTPSDWNDSASQPPCSRHKPIFGVYDLLCWLSVLLFVVRINW